MDERDFPPGTFWRLTLPSGNVRDAYVGHDGRAYWLTAAPDYEGPAAALGVPFIWLPWWKWRYPPTSVERLTLQPASGPASTDVHEGVVFGIRHPGPSPIGCPYCIDTLRLPLGCAS